MGISIIIPTLNRTQVLWNTVDQLIPQIDDNDELLIIDQNSPFLSLPKILIHKNIFLIQQSNPSLTKARNLGIEKSKGDHILFLDDDIKVPSDLLKQHRIAIEKRPATVFAGAVDQEDLPETEGVGNINLKSGQVITNYSTHKEFEVEMFPGGHVLFPVNCLPKKPLFNPWFKGSAEKEEIDLALRLRKKKIKILFNPKARIFHLKESTGGCRDEKFQANFFYDKCHNEALFFGLQGNLIYLFTFLSRMKNLVEYFSRVKKGHDSGKVLKAAFQLCIGFQKGLFSRIIHLV